jgi:hypothetical protein
MLPSGPFEPFTFHVRRTDGGAEIAIPVFAPRAHAERCARVMLYLIGIQARHTAS